MPKSPNQKAKLLYIAKILEEESDENHPLSIKDLATALDACGIAAERKSLYDDIETLSRFGMDIIAERRGSANVYYLGQRRFQLAELKLLVDAVQSAKFITEGKSRQLIKNICSLASRHEGGLMQRQVQVAGRAKTVNERTYYNVDAIHTAIAENRKISFEYFEWVVDEKSPRLFSARKRHGGKAYLASPWALLWDDEYYYLVAYDDAADMVKHYRVDKMEAITVTGGARTGQNRVDMAGIAAYSKSVFGMFGGSEEMVSIRFHNSLIGVVVDRFGSDITIHKSGSEHFTIHVKVVASPQFSSWIFGFGTRAQVLAPASLVAQLQQEIADIATLYHSGTAAASPP